MVNLSRKTRSGADHWNYGKHWAPEILEKMKESHLVQDGEFKLCLTCNQTLPIDQFALSYTRAGKHRHECRTCRALKTKNRKHAKGIQRPMSDAKESSVFLGVHIAERVLSAVFGDIKRMPYGNPGYDFICKNGFKIDVKSSCLHPGDHRRGYWKFQIKYNTAADHFLCLAFDNRESLNPLHIWLIPGVIVSGKKTLNISNSTSPLKKWKRYERPIDKISACCDTLRGSE